MQGLLLLNKPAGMTSFAAVAALKRLAGEKRVGHTGTLDPMATGVLPVLFGRATALSGLLLEADKRYTAAIRLGLTTDSDDITGRVLVEKPVAVTPEQLTQTLTDFTGTILQRPPAYSAIKKDGVRLYRLAREGKSPEVPARQVTVHAITQTSPIHDDHVFTVDVRVSKGTYIRSLARDIGQALGCGACLSSLCRTAASGFDLSDCVPLDRLTAENIGQYVVSEERAVSHLRAVSVTEKQAVRFCNGGQLAFERLKLTDPAENELFRVKFGDTLLGVGRADILREEVAIACVLNRFQGG